MVRHLKSVAVQLKSTLISHNILSFSAMHPLRAVEMKRIEQMLAVVTNLLPVPALPVNLADT